MKIIESIEEMQEYSQQLKRDGKTIACVATEGYLHDGHMSLIKIAKENADVVVMSIQTTISPLLKYSIEWPKDYKKYLVEEGERHQQHSLKNDLEICRKHKVDIFFYPSMIDYYSNPAQTITIYHAINKRLLNTPHMNYVGEALGIILMMNIKVWNSVLPDIIIEGQKDIHMTLFIKAFLDYFHYPIKLIIAPTARDSDGLACSSRNRFLSKSERQDATSVYQSLQEVSNWSEYPLPHAENIKNYIREYITRNNGNLWYIEICCIETLEELDLIDRKAMIVVAAKFGKSMEGAPLINAGPGIDIWDNIIIEPK